ncbi:uncharacterized protein LOC109818844 [Cajanus cajan]|nr:uncharacterized protein LOC109818844 [Cajanus cajan]
MGHIAKYCKHYNPRRDEAQMAHEEDNDSEKVLLMATTVQAEGLEGNSWYLDTGCSTHMTRRKDWFASLDELIKSKVKFADARVLMAEGVGKITVKKKKGDQVLIIDVLFVPGLKSNLLSLGYLLEKGYTSRLENKMLRVYDKQNHLILKSPLTKNRTFKVEIDVVDQECLAVTVKKEEWLWHYRLGHLNFRDLQNLKSKDMVRGLPHISPPNEVCSDCMESKQLRNSFQ